MGRPMVPEGGDDRVYTPSYLAKQIVDHFRPEGRILEPCKGTGAFLEYLPLHTRWMEIDEGRDFLNDPPEIPHYDWIVTNPPFSKLRHFLLRSLEQADDIVFLVNLNAILGLKARIRAIQSHGFAIKEILMVDTPPRPWPQSGFQLGAIHIQRGWSGPTIITYPNKS